MSLTQKYFCFAANPAANDGTAVAKAGYLVLGGATNLPASPNILRNAPFQLNLIKNGVFKAYAAEVLRVITVTPTAANSTDYRLVLSAEKGLTFNNNLPNEIQSVFTHSTPASGATATTIGDAFRAAINAHPFWSTRVVATGTTTLIITAKAGFPIFSAAGGPLLATVVSTAGSPEYGAKGADLLATGQFSTDTGLPVAGQTYSVMIFESKPQGESVLGNGADEKTYLYINNGGNYAALITALSALVVR